MPRKSIDRRTFLKDIVIGVTTVAALGGLAACATDKAPMPPASAGQTGGESPSPSAHESTNTGEWLPKQGDYLSPENLSKLETAQQITDAFTLHKGDFKTIEEFARLDTYREQQFYNAGTTNEEWSPYGDPSKAQPESAFADAETKRYTKPMLDGIYIQGITNNDISKTRYAVLGLIDVSRQYAFSEAGKDEGATVYTLEQQFRDIVTTEGSIESGDFKVVYRLNRLDNLDETQLKVLNPDLVSNTIMLVKTVEMKLLSDGSWKMVSAQEVPTIN